VGVGVDADVVHAIGDLRSGQRSASGGYLKWVRPIYRTLRGFRFPRMTVEIDGRRTYRASSCIVQNACNYGGLFQLAPDAGLATGTMEALLLRGQSRRDLFKFLFGAWQRRIGAFQDVKIIKAQKVRLHAEPASRVQADGDASGHTDLSIELLPQALTLLRAPEPEDD
jgi:diacylglycerol kinase family enzyme